MQKLQTSALLEFEQLKDRLRKAEEYFATKYESDAAENQQKAEQLREQVKKRMSELWEEMSLTLELDPNKTVDEWESQLAKYSERFLYPVIFTHYTKRMITTVRLEPPAFWKDTITRIEVNK